VELTEPGSVCPFYWKPLKPAIPGVSRHCDPPAISQMVKPKLKSFGQARCQKGVSEDEGLKCDTEAGSESSWKNWLVRGGVTGVYAKA